MKMKTRTSPLYRRTVRYQRGQNTRLSGLFAILFAAAPLGVMLAVLPSGGFGIA
jgi:hypothetical protein